MESSFVLRWEREGLFDFIYFDFYEKKNKNICHMFMQIDLFRYVNYFNQVFHKYQLRNQL